MSTRDPFQQTEAQYFISLGPEAYDPVLEHLREARVYLVGLPPHGRDRADALEAVDQAMTLVRDMQRDKRPRLAERHPSRAQELSDEDTARMFGVWEGMLL